MHAHPPDELLVRDLGLMPYQECLGIQRAIHERVLSGDLPPTLVLVEHPPVITVSRRPGANKHLLATPDQLAGLNIDLQDTDRGGDVTYHGPGQLVAYPIVRLSPLRLNVSRYIRLLEQAVIDTVSGYGVSALRDPCATGVWVGQAATPTSLEDPGPLSKLCAIGIRIRRGVTLHGLALNINPNLGHYSHLVPCGLRDRGVTSLLEILGSDCPTMQQVKTSLTHFLTQHLDQAADQHLTAQPS